MESFNLHLAFLEYLRMGKLDINTMSQVQKTETKRAFIAGCGYMFRAFGRTVEMDLETADDIIRDMEQQIALFWNDECVEHDQKG